MPANKKFDSLHAKKIAGGKPALKRISLNCVLLVSGNYHPVGVCIFKLVYTDGRILYNVVYLLFI